MQLIWLRSDLRVHDNTALCAAMEQGPTLAVYMISPAQWASHDDAPCKVDFWLRNLVELKTALATLNVPLLIVHADTWDKAPTALMQVCKKHGIEKVHVNEEYGINESRRDDAVDAALSDAGIHFQSHLDQLFFKPGSVLTKTGSYFKVFSQFRKVCYTRFHQSVAPLVRLPGKQKALEVEGDDIPDKVEGFAPPSDALRALWPAGEQEARKRLETFADAQIEHYLDERDFPAKPGTSQLSAYLAAGVVSPRQCLHAALSSNQGEFETGNAGIVTWINELLWREFYKHVLTGFPRVSRHRAFRPETEAVKWRQSPKDLEAWKQGRTGFPIVDAAMRQLLETGWMHNRLRMVVAMFFSKNLLLDWREGERFFMQHLIDGDLAANNGGWQWSSSTGTDSTPYFRIFNPLSQSERFDAQGVFIKRWVPELASRNKKDIHNPISQGSLFGDADYAAPIVDLKSSRARALAAFKSLPHLQAAEESHE
ncbi:deoxyribodipyrimidine photo-lyase [Pseudomonas huanghezhanensis]|uniref:deoxyribodipyrimidine photo-lyase n=1 Tax=Pseudomonas huanghezhanensis TaxID=3002903 RepID=UPI0022860491|nr:deoxyribodipyrimidine photo-lyase [Pseudomonas sp. BSw22131]